VNPSTSLEGRRVLVTGAAQGLGRTIAERIVDLGGTVVIADVQDDQGAHTVAAIGAAATYEHLDVSSEHDWAEVCDRVTDSLGGLDGLVNNAGLHHRGPLEGRSAAELAAMVDVNLRAPLVLTRLALPHLRARGGFVVNVASLAGKVPLDGAATYSATKFGLRALTVALAEELRGTGVTVSVVSPGPIDTGFILDDLDSVEDIVFSQTMCSAEHVADMILACARDGRVERQFPEAGGALATLGYLLPGLRRRLKPLLSERGRRVKERLRAERERGK